MTRRYLGWFLAAAALTLVAAATAPAYPAEEKAPAKKNAAGKQEAAAPAETPDAMPTGTKEGNQTVETILRQQEELLTGQRFSYDPAGRRDPFRSLYEEIGMKRKGPRPKGVSGMLVTEVDLTGIVHDATGGDLAVFMGSDNKGYFLRVGDEVYDGTVIAVDPGGGTVTFRQQVDDPRLIKPYRDVVKRLTPSDGEEKANE
jgi:hypothetical protein